jgi:anti-sigma B factor antagonist
MGSRVIGLRRGRMQIELHTRRPFGAHEEDVGAWRVLHVTGEVDAATAGLLPTLVVYAVRRGARQVCLDLSAVERVDRSGAEAPRRCTRVARYAGGRLAMIEPGDPDVAGMLAESGVSRDVPHYSDRGQLPGPRRPVRGRAGRA